MSDSLVGQITAGSLARVSIQRVRPPPNPQSWQNLTSTVSLILRHCQVRNGVNKPAPCRPADTSCSSRSASSGKRLQIGLVSGPPMGQSRRKAGRQKVAFSPRLAARREWPGSSAPTPGLTRVPGKVLSQSTGPVLRVLLPTSTGRCVRLRPPIYRIYSRNPTREVVSRGGRSADRPKSHRGLCGPETYSPLRGGQRVTQ